LEFDINNLTKIILLCIFITFILINIIIKVSYYRHSIYNSCINICLLTKGINLFHFKPKCDIFLGLLSMEPLINTFFYLKSFLDAEQTCNKIYMSGNIRIKQIWSISSRNYYHLCREITKSYLNKNHNIIN